MSATTQREVTICPLGLGEQPELEQMYASFEPKRAAMGLPPGDPVACRNWLNRLLLDGINLVARAEGRIVGHLVLAPSRLAAEMAVFVHQDWRNHGVGSQLVASALEEARLRGLRYVWVLLTSDHTSHTVPWLSRFGFQSGGAMPGEVTMIRIL